MVSLLTLFFGQPLPFYNTPSKTSTDIHTEIPNKLTQIVFIKLETCPNIFKADFQTYKCRERIGWDKKTELKVNIQ